MQDHASFCSRRLGSAAFALLQMDGLLILHRIDTDAALRFGGQFGRSAKPNPTASHSARTVAMEGPDAQRSEQPAVASRVLGMMPDVGSEGDFARRGEGMADRYFGCDVRTTVSGDSSDHTLASDTYPHTCGAGPRRLIIIPFTPKRYELALSHISIGSEIS